jgi:hypothetical protein
MTSATPMTTTGGQVMITVSSIPQEWVNDGVLQQLPVPHGQPPEDDLFIVRRRLLIEYYQKKRQLSDLEERLNTMSRENEQEKERLDKEIATLHREVDELKRKEVEREAMMRVAEVVRLLDRHISRSIYRDSDLFTLNDVLKEKRLHRLGESEQQSFNDVVKSFHLDNRTHLTTISAVRTGIARFREDRNFECHGRYQEDIPKDEFYQVIEIFCESFHVHSAAEMEQWKMKGRELVDIVYGALGDHPFQQDRALSEQDIVV